MPQLESIVGRPQLEELAGEVELVASAICVLREASEPLPSRELLRRLEALGIKPDGSATRYGRIRRLEQLLRTRYAASRGIRELSGEAVPRQRMGRPPQVAWEAPPPEQLAA